MPTGSRATVIDPDHDVRDRPVATPSGLMMLGLLPTLLIALVGLFATVGIRVPAIGFVLAILFILGVIGLFGFFMVAPNQAAVLTLFGRYVGTARETGLRWTNPFYGKTIVSQRVRNFESGKLKVNDRDGSPIEIAAIVVWQVTDAAEAIFNVDSYQDFVAIQAESALRQIATAFPYEDHEGDGIALRSHANEVSERLQEEIQERLARAGVAVLEARISHLAYAPEIAGAMLQRQQAAAIVAARTRIVEGAVGMVELALEKLSEKQVVTLDEERKAAMVSNLLVVLCDDRGAQPVVNSGTLY